MTNRDMDGEGEIKVETEKQSIRHVDHLGRARVQSSLQFWNKKNDPVENEMVNVQDDSNELVYGKYRYRRQS